MFRLPPTPYLALLAVVLVTPLLAAWASGRLSLAPVLFAAGVALIAVSLTRRRP